MLQRLRAIFLFDTSSVEHLQSIRSQILADNRRFAIIWALVQFLYGCYSLLMSFWRTSYTLCRDAYLFVMLYSALAFFVAMFAAKKKPLAVYPAMLLNLIALYGSSLLIAWILLRNDTMTIMIFAAALIAPVMFVNNTLLNILVALVDIAAAAILLRNGLTHADYGWCLSNLVIISSMGVVLGHFINKSRYERYVFAESAVRLAESSTKLAELQTRYAYCDQMTDLKNRRAFSEQIEALAKDMPANCCLVTFDVNGLKRTNDMLGHAAGDELIVATADCLRRSFERLDTIYRLGGDEFAVITDAPEAEVRKNLARLEQICKDWKGQYIRGVSLSYGLASTADFREIASILKEADQRMYAFKKNYYETVGNDRRQH